MKAKKKRKEYKVGHFLNELAKVATINEDGKLTYKGFKSSEILRLLQYFTKFPSKAEYLDKRSITVGAFKKACINNDFNESSFFNYIDEEIASELKGREIIFHILTTVSLNVSNMLKKDFEIDGCKIIFKRNSFSKIFIGRNEVLKDLEKRVGNYSDVSGYSIVEVEVKSRSVNEAFNRALDALNLLRALMSFTLNSQGIIAGDFFHPINKVRLGQFHTIHDKNGKCLEYPVYYEPEFKKANVSSIKDPEKLDEFISTMLSRIQTCQFSKKIQRAMVRFVSALDVCDKNVSVIKLWSILEEVLTEDEANCDNLPHRLGALFSDYELTRHIVMHIRVYRNEHVHQGNGDDESVHRAYHLQNLFIQLIHFLIHPENDFVSLKEAYKMLDKVASGEEQLRKEIELSNKALCFLGATPSR